ncbi:phage terminase small subunit P27 family [Amycolatopsis sp. lyj-112]|uniref:phage terminase small subunit P27 family n=1 Tax=Amycolatopsis sp. lyj-112 TaxID=2789288 RepID=UPI00397BADC3
MSFEPPKAVIAGALDEWNRLLPYMREQNYDVEENVQPYASYCIAVMRRDECEANIAAEGLLVKSRRDGHLVRNHATMIQQSANQTILEISKRFGFTPADKKALAQVKEEAGEDKPDWLKDIARK